MSHFKTLKNHNGLYAKVYIEHVSPYDNEILKTVWIQGKITTFLGPPRFFPNYLAGSRNVINYTLNVGKMTMNSKLIQHIHDVRILDYAVKYKYDIPCPDEVYHFDTKRCKWCGTDLESMTHACFGSIQKRIRTYSF